MDWSNLEGLGQLSGMDAARAAQGGSMPERLRSLGQVLRERLRPPREWDLVPLVVRMLLSGTSEAARRHLTALPRQVTLASPGARRESCGKQGSFLLLDLGEDGQRTTLTVVMYDWDELRLSRSSLEKLRISSSELESLLRRGVRPQPPMAESGGAATASANAKPPARWRVDADSGWIKVTTGTLEDDDLSPRVGRFALGFLERGWRVEVLAVPRLSDTSPRDEALVSLGDDPKATLEFLRATAWRRGSPTELMSLLELSRETALAVNLGKVRMQATEDPSPLAWLVLAETLEQAALHQRRQYVRVQQAARAPTGTLRVGSYVGNLARRRPDIVPVTRHILCHDTPENRLFRGMAAWVQRRTDRSGGLGAWMAHRFALIEASFSRAQPEEPTVWRCTELADRELPEAIGHAVAQIHDILEGTYPGLSFQRGITLEANSFELVVAELFESAARQILAQALGRRVLDGNVSVVPNDLKWVEGSGGSNRLMPDFVVTRGSEVIALGDAKYKRLARDTTFGPLGRADFHQLAAYLLAWPQARWGVVLLPQDAPRVEGARATEHVATLKVPGERRLGVFKVSPSGWLRCEVRYEPLTRWLASAQATANTSRPI